MKAADPSSPALYIHDRGHLNENYWNYLEKVNVEVRVGVPIGGTKGGEVVESGSEVTSSSKSSGTEDGTWMVPH
ncbi:conserved hypothetical protein [Ricinus communis]|uniref:Uncharacterized protein n=1 Tax=Ricinus communis TaxID=3988 RepID=B9SNK6_RICCO|nr:conserved hypothetical protein [Ricinus communis]